MPWDLSATVSVASVLIAAGSAYVAWRSQNHAQTSADAAKRTATVSEEQWAVQKEEAASARLVTALEDKLLVLTNRGQAVAWGVRLEDPSGLILSSDVKLPCDLAPGERVVFGLKLTLVHSEPVRVTFRWADDREGEQVESRTINLY